jgi:hypothetical protein
MFSPGNALPPQYKIDPSVLAQSIITKLQTSPEFVPMFIDELVNLGKEALSPVGEEVMLVAKEVLDGND